MLFMQILKARASLTEELQSRTKSKPEQDWSRGDTPCSNDISNVPHKKSDSVPFNAQSESLSHETPAIKPATSLLDADFETEKHPVQSTEIPIIDKSVIEERPQSSEIIGTGGTTIPIENEEDVSSSDLEEDDGGVPTSDNKVTYGSNSSTKESQDRSSCPEPLLMQLRIPMLLVLTMLELSQ
ncbi:BSD domain-containing protein [Actinidia rufa]|uniref:BSD domain-containing protein n=1 Tax=Actinidia rufa TaxID=165716 RepID=A0A7J0FL64_9ERIC|nr:BSD domain-containing protein [Actinidia rufa]